MRILHVIWNLGQGGAQTYLKDLLKAYIALNGPSCAVLVLTEKGPISKDIEALSIPVTYLGIRNGADVVGFFQLFKFIRVFECDIVHSHTSNILFNLILRVNTAKKVFTEHGGGLMGGEWKYLLVYKVFHKNYHRFIGISKACASDMILANPKIEAKTHIIYNGLDVAAMKNVSAHDGHGLPEAIMNARFRVGIVGRLVPQKGLELFLETSALLARLNEDMVFVIVGDGPQMGALEDKANQLGIGDKVFFLGYRTDAKRILKLFDVYLFTSEWEPFGLVIVEAMALGVPIVAINLNGAVAEIIRHDIDGLVIARREPSLLTESVMKLLDNSDLRERLSASAVQRVENNFTIEYNAQQVLEVYNSCLSC